MKNNIQVIVENALCTACGACAGICPKDAISMITNIAGYLIANINYDRCTYCGMCYKICPSNSANTPSVKDNDIFHGKYLAGYIGHAADANIRQKSQSGGIVTALLCYLLEKKLIEGAVVNNFNKNTKRPEAVFETTREEIIKSAGSYYSQSSAVKTILEYKDKQMAAVVLGCQAESLHLIGEKYPNITLPAYIIGLICAGQYSGKYIDELIKESGCKKTEVNRFRFRDKDAGGWPGDVKIYTAKNEHILDKRYRHKLKTVYEHYRCLLCFDQMNIFSDITAGDPWGIAGKLDKKGNTVVVTRTERGQALIDSAVKDGVINIEPLPVENILKGQTVDSRLKTQFFTSLEIAKDKNYVLPFNEECFKKISYIRPSRKKFKEIGKRLVYSRKIFLETDIDNYKRSIIIRKRESKIQKAVAAAINIPKRGARYFIRKLGLV